MTPRDRTPVDIAAFKFTDFSLSNRDLFPDPYPAYRLLREHQPVHFSAMYGGSWVFFAYDDVVAMLREPRLTNNRALMPLKTVPKDQWDELEDIVPILSDWVAFFDGEKHEVRRRHMNRTCQILMQNRVGPRVQVIVDQLLNGLKSHRTIDLIADFARPLPAMVIADLLGAPIEDCDSLIRWSDDIAFLYGSSRLTLDDLRRGRSAVHAFATYLSELGEKTRIDGRDTILARLLTWETDGFRFTPAEAYAQCMLLMFAGLEPTRYLIGNAIHTLDQHPDQFALLRSNPALLPSAIEEILRYDTPVQFIGRVARDSFTYKGHSIEAGQVVLPYVGSANRDPAYFREPERFDIQRKPNRHLAFGQGPHSCIAATLVRVQTELALRALLNRMPDLGVAPEAPKVWNSNLGFHGFQSLTIRTGN